MKKSIRHTGTFYFFPALLPLAAAVPWLMTAMGIVASAAGLSIPQSWRKYKFFILGFAVISFAFAGGFYLYSLPNAQVAQQGTRLIEVNDYPALETFGEVPAFADKTSPKFGKLWTVKLKRKALSSPVIDGDLLIYGSYDYSVEAVSLQNGARAWSLAQDSYVLALTKEADGNLYAGEGLHDTLSASLTSIDPQTGVINWRREFLGHVEETAALNQDHSKVFTGAGASGIWALNPKNADVLWHQAIGHIDAKPLVLDGVVYVPAQVDETTHKTNFYALDEDSGKVRWSLSQPGQPWGSPLIDKTGQIIMTTTGVGQIGVERDSDKGWAYGISRKGDVLWYKDIPSMPLQPASYVPEHDLIIHTTKSGHIVALNVNTGDVAWQEKMDEGDAFNAPATLITHTKKPLIASISNDGVLSIRDAATGVELARRNVAKKTWSPPVAKEDVLYALAGYELTAFGGLKTLVKGD